MIPYLKPDTLVFDIGGWKGEKTQEFLDAGCKVVVAEPILEMQEHLEKKFGDKIILEKTAIGGGIGNTQIWICRDTNETPLFELSSMSSEFRKRTTQTRFSCFHYKDGDFRSVPVTTLDALIKKHGQPDFIKIDVEGYELQVLSALNHPARVIRFEFTPELIDQAIYCVRRILQMYQFYNFNYSSGETQKLHFERPVSFWELFAYLATIKDYMKEFGDIYAVRET